MMPLPPPLSESEALARVLADIQPVPAQSVALSDASERFNTRDIFASLPLPAFDNSSMDGYALPVTEGGTGWPEGARFRVTGEQPAGRDRGLRVGEGEAVRIFTGAPLPHGTGAVVMQEDARREADHITLRETVAEGEFIRRAGADVCRGQRIVERGERLAPPLLGLLASQGETRVEVGGVPRVSVLTTGDELRAPGSGPLRPGEIYESNGTMMAALAGRIVGAGSVFRLGHSPDETGALDDLLARGLSEADVLIITGGVSVGEHDLVKECLKRAGVRLDVWRVSVRPGKPFLYGCNPGKPTHVFGLPGNPVSAFVTFLLFVRPALLKLMGAAQLTLPFIAAATAVELVNRGDRPHYVRGRWDESGRFILTGSQEAHALAGLSRSCVLVRLEAGAGLPAGSTVRAFPWRD